MRAQFGLPDDREPEPELDETNIDAVRVFQLCHDQVVVTAFGQIVGMRNEAIVSAMDVLGIRGTLERERTLIKVKALARALYGKKQKEEDECYDDDD